MCIRDRSNEFSLTASGELDNGMTWSYAQDIDGATVQDDANITLGTDYGTIKICVSECRLSTKYAFDNSAYGIGSDNGYGHGAAATSTMQYGSNISSYNNVQYHLQDDLLPFGLIDDGQKGPEVFKDDEGNVWFEQDTKWKGNL